MRRRARETTVEKGTPRYGRPRGWRPRAEEEASPARNAELGDVDAADADADGVPDGDDYGIKIIWGSSKRRPGAKLEKLARRS